MDPLSIINHFAREKPTGWETMGRIWPRNAAHNFAREKPALGTHRGKVWCIWQSFSSGIMYSNLDVEVETWSEPKSWPYEHPELPKKARMSPALASMNEELHCVYSREENGQHVYAVYMEKEQRWGVESLSMGSSSTGNLALATFKLKDTAGSWLICVFQKSVQERRLYYQVMNPFNKRWSNVFDTGHCTNLSIDLTVIHDEVWLIFGGLDDARQALVAKLGKLYEPFTPALPVNLLTSAGYSWDAYQGSLYIASRSRVLWGSGTGLSLAEAHVDTIPLCETDERMLVDVPDIVTTPTLRIIEGIGICVWLIDEGKQDANLLQHYSMKWARKVIAYTGKIQVYPHVHNWMSAIPDTTSVASLSIPGTHDSGTIPTKCFTVPTITDELNFSCCQSMTLSEQLQSGIRYFDIRVNYLSSKPTVRSAIQLLDPFGWSGKLGAPRVPQGLLGAISDGLYIAHGPYYFQMLDLAFKEFYSFLDTNPSEGILVSIKREGGDDDEATTLDKVLDLIRTTKPSRWRLDQDLPTMGQVRGKIQLVRRCNGSNVGINLTDWPGNTTQDYTSPFAHRISDQYDVYPQKGPDGVVSLAFPVKMNDISSMMDAAQSCGDPNKLHITCTNFTAGNKDEWLQKQAILNPHTTAAGPIADEKWPTGLNGAIYDAVRRRVDHKRPIGIIAMDFPESEPDLIGWIIRSNPDFLSKERRASQK